MGEVNWHVIFLRLQKCHYSAAYWFYLFLGSSKNVQGAEDIDNGKAISRLTWLEDGYSKKSTFQWLDIQIQIKRLDIPWPLSHCLTDWVPLCQQSNTATLVHFAKHKDSLCKAQGLDPERLLYSPWIFTDKVRSLEVRKEKIRLCYVSLKALCSVRNQHREHPKRSRLNISSL